MSLDKLIIIFLIIILPISLVLTTYTRTQTDTLNTQLAYDVKLNNATYDALKAYQLNAFNEDASSLANVRLGNIDAAVNTFYSSLSASLNMSGYNRAFLESYVPAIVFTTYDGYYIYSKYTNNLSDEDYYSNADWVKDGKPANKALSHYQNGDLLYGLKPFIHYSCRYKIGSSDDNDFVITYSMDNYITIHGIINGNWVDDEGYLIDVRKIDTIKKNNKTLKYRGVTIGPEEVLQEKIIMNGETEPKLYKYHKVNGVKYYLDENSNTWFSVLNGETLPAPYSFDENNFDGTKKDCSAFDYYYNAYTFTQRVTQATTKNDDDGNKCYGLGDLVPTNAYQVVLDDKNNLKTISNGDFLQQSNKDGKIFDTTRIEEPDSKFNEHRLAVIRYSIERNLSIAIKNYNQYKNTGGSIVQTDFQMPKFNEQEWDRIQNNVSIISYLQGLPIGTKIYNGVSVISNNVNDEVVTEDSIHIAEKNVLSNPSYYPIKYASIVNKFKNTSKVPLGVFNVDLERKQYQVDGEKKYYYPKLYYSSYDTSTVNLNAETYKGNLYTYLDKLTQDDTGIKIVQAYYTALGRERQGMYKQSKNYEELFNKISVQELELQQFNSQFEKYKGKQSGAKVKELIKLAKENNARNSAGDETKRVNVRRGSQPTWKEFFDGEKLNSNVLSDNGRNFLNGYECYYTDYNGSYHYVDNNTQYATGSFVVPRSQDEDGKDKPDSYTGGTMLLLLDDNAEYEVKFFYYDKRIKGIYVSASNITDNNDLNARFTNYEGSNKTKDDVKDLINDAITYNVNNSDTENARIIVRQGGGPTLGKGYLTPDKSTSKQLTKTANDILNGWETGDSGSYVVVTSNMSDKKDRNGYLGGISIGNDNSKYTVNCYYYNGLIKAIYISRPY